MQYTSKNVNDLAKETGLQNYKDYAFLLSFLQSGGEKRPLTKKWVERTNNLFKKFHIGFVDNKMNVQHRNSMRDHNISDDIHEELCDNQLDVWLKEV